MTGRRRGPAGKSALDEENAIRADAGLAQVSDGAALLSPARGMRLPPPISKCRSRSLLRMRTVNGAAFPSFRLYQRSEI